MFFSQFSLKYHLQKYPPQSIQIMHFKFKINLWQNIKGFPLLYICLLLFIVWVVWTLFIFITPLMVFIVKLIAQYIFHLDSPINFIQELRVSDKTKLLNILVINSDLRHWSISRVRLILTRVAEPDLSSWRMSMKNMQLIARSSALSRQCDLRKRQFYSEFYINVL